MTELLVKSTTYFEINVFKESQKCHDPRAAAVSWGSLPGGCGQASAGAGDVMCTVRGQPCSTSPRKEALRFFPKRVQHTAPLTRAGWRLLTASLRALTTTFQNTSPSGPYSSFQRLPLYHYHINPRNKTKVFKLSPGLLQNQHREKKVTVVKKKKKSTYFPGLSKAGVSSLQQYFKRAIKSFYTIFRSKQL